MSSLIGQLGQIGGAVFNLFMRIIYLPFAVFAWGVMILQSWKLVLTLLAVGGLFYGVGLYGGTVFSAVINGMTTYVNPFYNDYLRPILSGIIREFFNRIVCWYNAVVYYPYGFGRLVLYPIFRDGGFGQSVTNFSRFIGKVGSDFILGYVFSRNFFSQPFDYTGVFASWQTFWTTFQGLWCYGCQDLCPLYTKFPLILVTDQFKDPQWGCFLGNMFNGWMYVVQQLIYLLREIIWPTQPTLPVPNFDKAFDYWCAASTCFWTSMENIFQETWNNYIAVKFVFKDLFCGLDKINCMMMRTFQLLLNILLNSEKILKHFSGYDSTYWSTVIKEQAKVIINMAGPPAIFDPIVVPIIGTMPQETMTITHYQLKNNDQVKPDGLPNPLYNQTTIAQCICIAITRIICDPQNNGTTCAQQYNNTLLKEFDPCCFTNQVIEGMSNWNSMLFEFTLHLRSANDFVVFLDKQPFTTFIKFNMADASGCIFAFFKVIKTYGFCLYRVFYELSVFFWCTAELVFRIFIASVTLPYYKLNLPGMCNFISCADNVPLDMALMFLDRISDVNAPDGLINCLCFLLNTGFKVPFAGCTTVPCVAGGFVPPPGKRFGGSSLYNMTAPAGYYANRLTPILTYGDQLPNSVHLPAGWDEFRAAKGAFSVAITAMSTHAETVFDHWNQEKCSATPMNPGGSCQHPSEVYRRVMEPRRGPSKEQLRWDARAAERQRGLRKDMTSWERQVWIGAGEAGDNPDHQAAAGAAAAGDEPTAGLKVGGFAASHQSRLIPFTPAPIFNCTDPMNPPPCFNLCCLPVKLIQLMAHFWAFVARLLNAAVNTTNGTGSNYFSGKSCTMLPNGTTTGNCFASDLTMLVVKSLAPIECICEFIKLVIPPAGFADPCCAITVLGELASCVLQILVNIGNSVAGDSPNFTYIKDPRFLVNDFRIVTELALSLFDCICNFIRVIFAVIITGVTKTHKAFDPCCLPRVQVKALLLLSRVVFRTILSLSTLETESSQCYIYVRGPGAARPNCPIAIADLPIVMDMFQVWVALFATPGNDITNMCGVTTPVQMQNTDEEGMAVCICRMVNAILAMVFKFVLSAGYMHTGSLDDNAEPVCVLNLCCWFYRFAQLFQQILHFAFQSIASIWQNWQSKRLFITPIYGVETFYIPQETMDFLFCDEYGPDAIFNGSLDPTLFAILNIGNLNPYPTLVQNMCANGLCANPNASVTAGIVNVAYDGTNPATLRYKCGKFEPVLTALENLLGKCICTTCHLTDPSASGIGNMLDRLLRWALAWVTFNSAIFPFTIVWPACLCCGGPMTADIKGMVRPAAMAFTVLIRQVVILFRNIPNPSYWSGQGTSLSAPGPALNQLADNLEDIKKTWINRFLAPFADALCRLFTNAGCLLTMVLGDVCTEPRYGLLSSAFAYVSQAVIRYAALIEGAVKLIAQEAPGLCVGNKQQNAGNANDPSSQGSTGDGQLIPTCSPNSNVLPYGKIDGNQLGRIVVSLATFIVDALIGLGRLGCTSICPGLGSTNLQINLLHPNQTCGCYDLTPYVGVGGVLCSFKTCDVTLNSGLGTFRCPNNASSCTYEEAIMPPSTGQSAFLAFPPTFCNQGCANNTAINTAGTIYSPAGSTWWRNVYPQYSYLPEIDPTDPTASSLRCRIMNPLINNDTTAFNKATQFFGMNYRAIVDNYDALRAGCYTDQYSNVYTQMNMGCPVNNIFQNNLLTGGAAYANQQCTVCLNWANETRYMAGGPLFNATIQPVCNRKWCVSQGWCKNDQLVPCYPGQPILDGIVIVALRYVKCLIKTLFGGFGDFLGGVFDIIIGVLVFLWQLSGGIIRFVVQTGVIMFNFLTRIPFVNFFQAIPDILGMFGSFFAIFTQPVVFVTERSGVKGAFGTFHSAGSTKNSMEDSRRDLLRRNFEIFFDYDDAHDCVELNPTKCFCRVLNMSESCRYDPYYDAVYPSDITLGKVLNFTTKHFDGTTSCDLLFKYLSTQDIQTWAVDVPYAQRYQAVECLTKRSQGERWNEYASNIPPSFFYNPKGVLGIYDSIVGSAKRYLKRDHLFHQETRQRRAGDFRKRFGQDMDTYYRVINARGFKVRQFYEKAYGMDTNSPVMWPLMNLDMYHFKYRTGYYHYLVEKALANFADPNAPSIFGSFQENLDELHGAVQEMITSFRQAMRTSRVGDHLTRIYHMPNKFSFEGARSPHEGFKMPEAPMLFRGLWDGSLMQGVREAFPLLHLWRSRDSGAEGTPGTSGSSEQSPDRAKRGQETAPRGEPFALETFTYRPYDSNLTPEIQRNRDSLKRLIYSIGHAIWPQATTRDVHERFILDGNCRIVDGAVNLAVNLTDYCLTEFHENIPTRLGDLWTQHRAGGYRHEHRHGRITWETRGTGDWKRPRVVREVVPLEKRVHPHVYQRATLTTYSFLGQILATIGNWIGIDLLQIVNDAFNNIIDFFTNPGLVWPNVGLRYWFIFTLRCQFPLNVNCSIGVGLKTAIWQVGLVYLIVFLVLAALFPAALNALTLVFSIIVYVILVAVWAWHYSPSCAILFPASELGKQISIPVLPIPLNFFPLIPECFWDDVISLLDEVFAPVYTWIPTWMNNAPQGSGHISVPDCTEVGIANPLEVLIYWGYRIFGTGFCDFMIGLSTNSIVRLFANFTPNARATCFNIRGATADQMERNQLCGIATIGQLAWVGLGGYLLGTAIFTIVMAIIAIIHALILLFPALPFYDALMGMGSPQGAFVVPYQEEAAAAAAEEGPPRPIEARFVPNRVNVGDWIARRIQRTFLPHVKIE